MKFWSNQTFDWECTCHTSVKRGIIRLLSRVHSYFYTALCDPASSVITAAAVGAIAKPQPPFVRHFTINPWNFWPSDPHTHKTLGEFAHFHPLSSFSIHSGCNIQHQPGKVSLKNVFQNMMTMLVSRLVHSVFWYMCGKVKNSRRLFRTLLSPITSVTRGTQTQPTAILNCICLRYPPNYTHQVNIKLVVGQQASSGERRRKREKRSKAIFRPLPFGYLRRYQTFDRTLRRA